MLRFMTAGLVASLLAATASAQSPISAMPASDFVDRMGVNIHLSYTDGEYANAAKVLDDLRYLGITHVRDVTPDAKGGIPAAAQRHGIDLLAQAGIRFDLVVASWLTDLGQDMAEIDHIAAAHPGAIATIEGPNEINNWHVTYHRLKGQIAAETLQYDLTRAVRADRALQGVPVTYFTGGTPRDLAHHPEFGDLINAHPYPHNGEQPATWFATDVVPDFKVAPNVPRVITETGYYTLPKSHDWGGVDELTQAKFILNLYFDAADQGVRATYVYQLLDAYPDPHSDAPEKHFGLFGLSNSAKPSAVAVHNLTRALGGQGTVADTPPGSLAFTVQGLPKSGHMLLLQGTGHRFILALWNEPRAWDASQDRPIISPSVPLTIKLLHPAAVQAYDPLTNLSNTAMTSTSDVHIDIPDHPILLSITPD